MIKKFVHLRLIEKMGSLVYRYLMSFMSALIKNFSKPHRDDGLFSIILILVSFNFIF